MGGFIFLSLQEHRNRISVYKKGAYRIMCLGESMTAGGTDSYPFQLEEILNQRNIGIKFSVINKGATATNTSYILSQLEDNLNRYNPDMVITMMGINERYIKYYEDIPDANSMLFNKFRTYRFVRIIWMHIVNKIRKKEIYEPEENKRNAKLQPSLSNIGLKDLTEQTNFSRAEKLFKETVELTPRDDMIYNELGWSYKEQTNFSHAEESFKKAIEINPKNDRAYGCLAVLYGEIGKYRAMQEYTRSVNRLRLKYYNPITQRNYQKLKEILDRRGIRLVCVQYPLRSIETLKKIFEGQKGVIFVDNQRVFKEALKKETRREYFKDTFGGEFGHCTHKGNMLLAENIANVILKECFDR